MIHDASVGRIARDLLRWLVFEKNRVLKVRKVLYLVRSKTSFAEFTSAFRPLCFFLLLPPASYTRPAL